MTQDRNGNNHKAAGRPDGGQFDRKAGQGSDDDLVPAAEETLAEGCARRVREYGGGSADEDDALIAREGMNIWTPTPYEAFSTLIGDTVDGTDEDGIDLETMGSWMRSMHRVELRALEGVDGEYARDLRDGIRKYMAAAGIDEDGPQEDGDEELIREAGLDVYEPDPLDLADAIVNGGMDTLEAAGFDEEFPLRMGAGHVQKDGTMTVDARGNSHKAAGRPDGGRFDRKAGQGSDDDLDLDEADARLATAMPGMDADRRRMLIEAAMNAKASRRRVETLMELKPTAARMPKIGAHDTTHDIATKLGRHMLSGLDDDQRAEADARVASAYMRALELEPADTSGDRLVEWLKANKTKGSVTAGIDKDGVLHLLSTEPWARGWRGQTTAWMRGDKSGTRRTIRAVDVPTLVAASQLDVDDDQLTAVLVWRGKDDPADAEYLKSMRERGYHTPELDRRIAVSDAIHGFRKALDARWSLEESRAENRRFTDRHSAGVFEDKIHCDTAHRKAAADCRLAGRYAHVELDDSVDLEEFARLDAEMEDLRRRHCLPVINPDNSFRFRLCGRHRAIGVYSPVDHAIAIDPRAPHSGAHEMAHAFDFEHGQLSASPEFRDILDRQRAALKNLDGISDSKRRYYATPTEVLARSAELYLLWTGRGSSLTSKSVDDLVAFDPSVRPLLDQRDAIVAFFDKVGLVG